MLLNRGSNNRYKYIAQGWQVSHLHGKTHGNYPVSADTAEILSTMGKIAERGESKFAMKIPN